MHQGGKSLLDVLFLGAALEFSFCFYRIFPLRQLRQAISLFVQKFVAPPDFFFFGLAFL